MVSDLTYDLRSSIPTRRAHGWIHVRRYGHGLLEEGKSGLMTAINEGPYAMVPLPDPKLDLRKVDVASMYNTERYRPRYDHKPGLPILLTRP